MTDYSDRKVWNDERLLDYYEQEVLLRDEEIVKAEILRRMSHKTCVWKAHNEYFGCSDCGLFIYFYTEDGEKREFKEYCHNCGGKIIIEETASETDHNPT